MSEQKPTRKRTYHHGDLRAALLDAAESVLADKGVEGFTLRECARRAGVSHAAPKHHFRDVSHLLTVLATIAFERLNIAMSSRREQLTHPEPRSVLQAIGEGYIAFAADNPHLFNLMFNWQLMDRADPDLKAQSEPAFMELASAIAAVKGVPDAMEDCEARVDVVLVWSVVHGFSQLFLLDNFKIGQEGQSEEARRAWMQTLSQQMVARLLQLFD